MIVVGDAADCRYAGGASSVPPNVTADSGDSGECGRWAVRAGDGELIARVRVRLVNAWASWAADKY